MTSHSLGYSTVGLASLALGLIPILVKYAYAAGLSTRSLLAPQFLVAALIMWAAGLARGRGKVKISRRDVWQLGLLGVVGVSGITGASFGALALLPASLASVLLFLFPAIVVGLNAAFRRRRPSVNKLLAVAAILGGAALGVNVFAADFSSITLVGLVLGVMSAFCGAFFNFYAETAAPDVPPTLSGAVIMSFATVATFGLVGPEPGWAAGLTASSLAWICAVGVVGQVVPTLCLRTGIPIIGSNMAAIIGALELPVTVGVAALLIGDRVLPIQWLGVLIVTAGVALAGLDEKGNVRSSSPGEARPHSC